MKFSKSFSTNNCLYHPNSNGKDNRDDQTKLFEKIESLEEEFDDIDEEVEDFFEDIVEREAGNGYVGSDDYDDSGDSNGSDDSDDSGDSEDSDDSEDETELSKFVQKKVKEKDDLVGEFEPARDRAAVEDNAREGKSVTLDLIGKVTDKDIDNLNKVAAEISEDYHWEKVVELIERLEKVKSDTAELKEEFHENDLPPILSSEEESNRASSEGESSTEAPSTKEPFKQDSSDVMPDDTEMPDYTDPSDV